jgi:hypothetical protein
MTLKIQFALFVIIIIIGLWLMFYKTAIRFGKFVNKYFKNIKDELEREE